MFSAVRNRLPLLVGIAAYVLALASATAVMSVGLHRVGNVLMEHLAARSDSRRGAALAPASAEAAPAIVTRRESRMTPLQGRWWDRSGDGARYGRYSGPQFGSSSRNMSRAFDDDDDDDERRPQGGTFRTVCVRLCDGYYFPISFSVTGDRLQRDAQTCSNRCGAQGRLFIQRSLDGSAEDMEDLAGRPYRQLPAAFLYRSEYVASCKCQPDPWEKEALDRHRMYAAEAAARRGDAGARKEVGTLRQAVEQAAAARAAAGTAPGPAIADADRNARRTGEAADGETLMRLGTEQPRPEPAPEPRRRDRGVIDRAQQKFGSSY